MVINGIQVHEDVLTTRFACDYEVCKGYCCHPDEPSLGCSITQDERDIIERNKDVIAPYVCDDFRDSFIQKATGMGAEGLEICSAQNGMCPLENGKCVLSILKEEGKLTYGKPKSCGLYPLCYNGGQKFLYIEDYFDNGCCDCAYAKGKRENIHIVDFLKDAIIKQFGEDFYNELHKHIR